MKFRSSLFLAAALFPAAALAQEAPATTVGGVTVTAAPQQYRSSIDRKSYSVANDLQATTGSVADVLRNVPSVEVDVQGNVSLRGDQSVTILVDGRPSGMFEGEGRADALMQMPADQIDRVEVMTNPSAAFKPEGSGGVINLVTKKNRKPGVTGSVRANVGSEGGYSGGISGAYNSEKLTVSGDASTRHNEHDSRSTNERERLVGDEWVQSRTVSTGTSEREGRNLRGSVEYNLDARTQLTAEVRNRAFGMTSHGVETREGDEASYRRIGEQGFERSGTELSTGFNRSFKGLDHELTVDLSREWSEGERTSRYLRTDQIPAAPEVFEDTRNENDRVRTELKADYKRPLPHDAKLNVGYEFELSENEYDNRGLVGPSADELAVDPARTNLFRYDQQIHSVYGTYERPFGKLTAQVGLRAEQTNVDINQVTSGITGSNDYFRLYPSLHLGYELDDNNVLRASYSERVRRPRDNDLNPYRVYIDPFNYRQGNPYLEPEETGSFELGWEYRKGQTFYNATAFYRQSEGGVTDVVQDIGDGVLLTTRENLGQGRSGGLELVANGRLSPTLTYNASTTASWREIDASRLGFDENRSGWSVGGRANVNWQPTSKDFFQANAMVMGKRLQAQGYTEPTGTLNLGYRRKVNDKLSLVATANDVLDTFQMRSVTDTPTLHDVTDRQMRGRSFMIGFTYALGAGRQQKRQRDPGFEFDNDMGEDLGG
ncbi:MAG TPA: outer membrane beta-barrel family protein [Caulobacteraceae bacterium]